MFISIFKSVFQLRHIHWFLAAACIVLFKPETTIINIYQGNDEAYLFAALGAFMVIETLCTLRELREIDNASQNTQEVHDRFDRFSVCVAIDEA